ncbi:MAG: nucleoside deaminase [Desulfosporosinus sp.]|jgi:guanine deaminase
MNKYIGLALEEAKKGMLAGKGGPFGAVVVKDGNVLSIASNEVLSSNDPTAHAEILAIRRASIKLKNYDLSGCIIYATGKPCPMCLAAIIWANIKQVYYSASDEEAEKIGFRDSMIFRHIRGEESILEMNQIESEAVLALYEKYSKLGKITY